MLPLVFLGSIPIAYLASPTAAELSWISLFVLMPLVGGLRRRADPEPTGRTGSEEGRGVDD